MQQTSRAVIWDSIIREEKDALIKQSVGNEYTINDQSGRLRGRDVRLTLHYDVMPIVGLLRIGRLTRTLENDKPVAVRAGSRCGAIQAAMGSLSAVFSLGSALFCCALLCFDVHSTGKDVCTQSFRMPATYI